MAISNLLPSKTRRSLNANDPRWKLKLILHLLIALSSLLGISLFASSIPLWNANFFHNKGPNSGDWTDGISLGPLAFTLLFTLISISYTFIRKGPSPPKVIIAMTVLIMVSLAPALILSGHGSLFRHWRPPAVRSQSGVLKCNLINIFSRECEPILYRVGELQIGGIVCGSLTWVFVFFLFLASLHETRANQLGQAKKSRLRRLTLMATGRGRYNDLANGTPWTGRAGTHTHSSSSGSRSSRHSRERSHEKRAHRQYGAKHHYKTASKEGQSDAVPFVHVEEPPAVYAHPGTRYM